MTEILIQRLSVNGRNWVRTHATDKEGFSLCSQDIDEELETVELGAGHVTCPDCIAIIRKCKSIPDTDEQPEYDNQLFWMR